MLVYVLLENISLRHKSKQFLSRNANVAYTFVGFFKEESSHLSQVLNFLVVHEISSYLIMIITGGGEENRLT